VNNRSQQIVQKLWSYCNLLRDDGLSYGDYGARRPSIRRLLPVGRTLPRQMTLST